MRRTTSSIAALAGLLTVTTFGSPASAQTAVSSAAAQALFDDARKLMAAGKLAEACPKFEESQHLDPGSGTLLNLAVCYEREGRTASAWTTYLEAANMAKAVGKMDRVRAAQDKANLLAPKLARISIAVAADRIASLEVKRDGLVLRPAMWGTAIPCDPGTHVIEATAPGRTPWKITLALREGAQETVTVPELKPVPVPESKSPPNMSASSSKETTPPLSNSVEPTGEASSQRVWAVVVGGLGVVGAGVGTYFGLRSISEHNASQNVCEGSVCPVGPEGDAGADALTRAVHYGNVSTVGFITAGVGLTVGAVLWLTAPSSKSQVGVGVGPSTLQVGGAW